MARARALALEHAARRGDVVVRERLDLRAAQARAGQQARMRELVDDDQIGGAREQRHDPDVGQITAAEHERGLGALEPREPPLERRVQRMIALDEARGAGAGAVTARGLARRGDDAWVVRESEVVVRGERN